MFSNPGQNNNADKEPLLKEEKKEEKKMKSTAPTINHNNNEIKFDLSLPLKIKLDPVFFRMGIFPIKQSEVKQEDKPTTDGNLKIRKSSN